MKALGREIRYVEYKLRRQQQEKKKKKQQQKDFTNGNGAGYNDMSNNSSGGATKTKEFNFEQENDFQASVANSVGGVSMTPKSEIEKARPNNQQEEQLQLEVNTSVVFIKISMYLAKSHHHK